MQTLRSTLDHLIHPSSHAASASSSRSSSPAGSPRRSRSNAANANATVNAKSKTASSCELFGILKALAASSIDADDGLDDPPSPAEGEPASPTTAESAEKARIADQLKDALDKSEKDRKTLSERFTALSMNNLSPLNSHYDDPESSQQRRDRRTRPDLPRSMSSRTPIDPSSPDWADAFTEPEDTENVSTMHTPPPAKHIEDDEKLAAINDEFGRIADIFLPPAGRDAPDEERMLAEVRGSLFKGVMMIGSINLTTHRLLFHAALPPESALFNSAGPDILKAGPVTLDRHGPLKTSRRLWMEIHPEMITTYPRGDETGRVRPLKTVLLSSITRFEPFDPDAPRHFRVSYETPHLGVHHLDFDVDTEESAVRWRRSLEAALFRHARRRWLENIANGSRRVDVTDDGWSTLRCCVPLDRVHMDGISQYHGFATLVGLQVEIDNSTVKWRPHDCVEGDLSGRIDEPSERERSQKHHHHHHHQQHHPHSDSKPHSPTRTSRANSPHRAPKRESTQYIDSKLPPMLAFMSGYVPPEEVKTKQASYDFNVAVLNDQAWFAEALQAAVAAAQEREYKPNVTRPKLVLEVAGYDCLATDEEVEHQMSVHKQSSSSDEARDDHFDNFTKDMRKAEKAAMASKIFGLHEDEGVYLKRCYVIQGVLPLRGHIILSRTSICFWRRTAVGDDIKYRFAAEDVKGAQPAPSLRHGFHGMALNIHGQHDLRFEFWSKSSLDDVLSRVQMICSLNPTSPTIMGPRTTSPIPLSSPSTLTTTTTSTSTTTSPIDKHPADILVPERELLFTSVAFPDEAIRYLPFIGNKPMRGYEKLTPRHFVCLTIGSRGDVQPYIALGLRLKKDDHRVTIVTHSEFKDWIEGYGIEHRQAGGDPTALMKLSAEHKMFSPGFFKESLGSFRQWLEDLLVDSWHACHDADVLIESPSTMSGIHIAEALKIPYFRAFTMPWTRTTAYPQAFMVPAFEMGPSFNYSTYVLFDNILWKATAGQINRWRKRHLKLHSTDMSTLSISKVPFLYNFSPAVVPKPLDWHDEISITGYWNLENSDEDWSPPDSLTQFMDKAKADGKPLVYIGFGSIVVPKPNAMTRNIIAAVDKADVRAIIAKGWSSRGSDPADEGGEVEFPDTCYSLEKVPHGWLFPKVDAAMHHGGAGTVGASLRAGIPTLIKPWFGDQFFWAIRVTKLGAGLKVPSLRTDDIAQALIKATQDKTMIEKAARVGTKIRSESGVDNALQAIQYNIIRAASDRSKMK